jgi:nicotinate-nucleotide adenylyltransferase
MKTLCLGGSFNPIHHGHLVCARSAMETAGYQRLAVIPSAQPPHKPQHADLATPRQRLRMCQLAIGHTATFVVEDIELGRTGPSYTLDTARALKLQGWSEVHWLIGADMLNYLPQWHRPLELLDEVHFLVMARPGSKFDWGSLPAEYQILRQRVVEVPQIDISSTQIRTRVHENLPIDYLTPPAVVEYIRVNRLYT